MGYQFMLFVFLLTCLHLFSNIAVSSAETYKMLLIQNVGEAVETQVFGQQPVISFQNLSAVSINSNLSNVHVNVSLYNKTGGGKLHGTTTVDVIGAMATFTDLSISVYGFEYTLLFQSSLGHEVISPLFTVAFMNLYTPRFNNSNTLTVCENGNLPRIVTRITAIDSDEGISGYVTYLMNDSFFAIDSNSGEVTQLKQFDREEKAQYVTNITATDGAPLPFQKLATLQLTVNVCDENDNAPVFTNVVSAIETLETAEVGTVVADFVATDADIGTNARIVYAVVSTNDFSNLFQLNQENGRLSVNRNLDLDRRTSDERLYFYNVSATDEGRFLQQRTYQNVNISIMKVNEYTPTFATQYVTVVLGDLLTAGNVIYQLNATDLDCDEDGIIKYSIVSGNDDANFEILETKVVLAASPPFSVDIFKLVINASDSSIDPNKRKWSFMILTVEASSSGVVVECKDEGMTIKVSMLKFPDHYTMFTLRNSSCRTDTSRGESGKKYGIVETDYTACGTTVEQEENDIVYSNQLFLTLGDSNALINRKYNHTVVSISCRFPRSLNKSLGVINVTSSDTIIVNHDSFGLFTAKLDLFNKGFNGTRFLLSDYPLKLTITSRLFLQLSLETNNPDVKLVPQNCFFTPTSNINDKTSYYIIQDRCDVDNTYVENDVTDKKIQFSFQAFSFATKGSSLFLHCMSIVCQKNSSNELCDFGCGVKKRRTRKSATVISEDVILSTKKIIFIDEESHQTERGLSLFSTPTGTVLVVVVALLAVLIVMGGVFLVSRRRATAVIEHSVNE